MPNKTYSWQGINQQGQICRGKQSAKNKRALEKYLANKHIIPIRIRQHNTALSIFTFISNFHSSKKPCKSAKITEFTIQLAALMHANISLNDALTILIGNQQTTPESHLLKKIQADIQQGTSLYHSLKKFPHYFSPTYLSLVQAGEQSGMLAILLTQLGQYRQKEQALLQQLKKAMLYPTTVLIVALLISAGLLLFVMPQFQAIFNNAGTQLPWLTRTMIGLSNHLQHHWLTYLSLAPVAFFLKKTRCCRHLTRRLPIISTIRHASTLGRWHYLLATLLEAGIPCVDALKTTAKILTATRHHQAMQHAIEQITNGEPIAATLAKLSLFPRQDIHMINIGEQSGTLATMLRQLSRLHQNQLDQRLENLSKLLEPVIIVLLAGIAGTLIIAMYLPIFQMGSAL